MKNSFILLISGLLLNSLTSITQQKEITSFDTLSVIDGGSIFFKGAAVVKPNILSGGEINKL